MSAQPSEASSAGLRAHSLSFPEILAQSFGNIAPSAAAATGPAIVFLTAGNGTWLSYLVAALLMGIVSLNVGVFARRYAGSGSFYSFTSLSLGSFGGFMSGWALLMAYICTSMIVAVGFGVYLNAFLGNNFDGKAAQILLYALGTVIATYVAFRDMNISARVTLTLELISVTLILLLAVIVLGHHRFAFDTAQLKLSGSSVKGVSRGLTLAILGLVGFEAAATLGAEAKNPFHGIPRAVVYSAALAGLFYVFMAYNQGLAFDKAGKSLGDSQAPLNDVAKLVGVGWLGRLLDLGVTVSFFACILACINSSARLLFTLARDRLVHSAMGHAHGTHQTPDLAVLLIGALTFIPPAVVVAGGTAPLDAIAYIGTVATFGFLLAYFLISIAAPLYLWRRARLTIFPAVNGIVAAVAMVYVFGAQVYPVPDKPYNVFPYIFLVYLLIGLAWYIYLRRQRPETVAQAGRAMRAEAAEISPGAAPA